MSHLRREQVKVFSLDIAVHFWCNRLHRCGFLDWISLLYLPRHAITMFALNQNSPLRSGRPSAMSVTSIRWTPIPVSFLFVLRIGMRLHCSQETASGFFRTEHRIPA
jgi:hypothetical protein